MVFLKIPWVFFLLYFSETYYKNNDPKLLKGSLNTMIRFNTMVYFDLTL